MRLDEEPTIHCAERRGGKNYQHKSIILALIIIIMSLIHHDYYSHHQSIIINDVSCVCNTQMSECQADETAKTTPITTTSMSAAPLFKKKRSHADRDKAPLRHSLDEQPDQQSDDKSNIGSSENTISIHDIRLLQKYRLKPPGLRIDSSNDASTNTDTQTDTTAQNNTRLLGASAFQSQAGEVNLIEEQMHKYIEEQIQQRRQAEEGGKQHKEEEEHKHHNNTNVDDDHEPDTNDDADHDHTDTSVDAAAAVVSVLPKKSTVLSEAEEESADRWLRGIAEVTLPISHRIENIERTEKARIELLHKQKQTQHTTAPVSILPANYNSNFAHHKQEWDVRIREEWRLHNEALAAQREEARAKGLKVDDGPRRGGSARGSAVGANTNPHHHYHPDQATDSRVVERFIKKFKSK